MELTWPPHYTVKRHARARHVKIKASVLHGIEVVTPMRFNQKNIPAIIEENKAWIVKRLLEIQEKSKVEQNQSLPEIITLHAMNQTWRIAYIKSESKKIKLILRPQQELVLFGDIENKILCQKVINGWVREYAQTYLVARIKELSEKIQLPYKKIIIRGQKTRWGSCTSNKTISLNYKLLFIPEEWVTHIIIHELCHTVHLNHSAKFWRLVASFDPQWKQHCRDIRRADAWVPVWAP